VPQPPQQGASQDFPYRERAEPLYDPYLAGPPQSTRTVQAGQKRHRLALAVAIGALFTALVAVGLTIWGVYHWQMLNRGPAAQSDDDGGTKSAALPAEDNDEDDESDDDDDAAAADVLQDTETQLRGVIEVVDVGVTSGALEDVLRTHYAIAAAKGQKLLVMTTGRRCTPCAGVDDALSHPLMQQALRDVRLVRVDLDVFGEELGKLRMPTRLYPGFFLLGEDILPIDAVHGGEWDDDIAENIAPVLGSFVRGEYKKRRHPEWSPTTTSIPI
jgi:hypothetical protein